VDQGKNFPQRGKRTDRIYSAPQLVTLIAAGHPFRKHGIPRFQLHFVKQDAATAKSPANGKLAPEKRVQRILNGHCARIASIIVWTTKRTKHPVIFNVNW
jgi:hypothetical protein